MPREEQASGFEEITARPAPPTGRERGAHDDTGKPSNTRTADEVPVSAVTPTESRTMFQAPAMYVVGAILFAIAFGILFLLIRH